MKKRKLNEFYLKQSLVNIVTMSDNSDYYSDSNSESDKSDDELETKPLKKQVLFKPVNNISAYEEDSDIEEENENEETSDNEIEQIGGVDDIDYGSDQDAKIDVESDDEVEDDNEDEVSDDDIELDEDGEPIDKTPVKKTSKKNTKQKKAQNTQIIVDDEEDDEEDEYDQNYLQKFDSEITKNYINEFHPECFIQNYDEISKLTLVVRDSNNIIIDPLHKTIPFLTKYEKARILGQRAKQIETGAKPLVKVPENVIDSYVIAELELKEKKIPFIIRRPLSNGGFEYWNLRDLENIGF
jgi:DNA-directed RNA polymerase I, II, and III subunit RPABC2